MKSAKMKGEKKKTKKVSLAWCESMKGRKGKEGRRRGVAPKREVK